MIFSETSRKSVIYLNLLLKGLNFPCSRMFSSYAKCISWNSSCFQVGSGSFGGVARCENPQSLENNKSE